MFYLRAVCRQMRRTQSAVKPNLPCLKLFVFIKNNEDDDHMLLYNVNEIENLPTAFEDTKNNFSNSIIYDNLQNQTAVAFSGILHNLRKDARFESALLSKMHQLLQQQNLTSCSSVCEQDTDMEKIYFDMRYCFDKTLDEPKHVFQICSKSKENLHDNTSSIQVGNASLQLLSHTLHTQFPVLLASACTGTQQMKVLAISKNDADKKEAAHFVLKQNLPVALCYPQTAKKCFEPLGYRSCYWQNREQMKKIHKLMCKDILLQNVNDSVVTHNQAFSIASTNFTKTLPNHLLQQCWSVFP